MKTVPGKMVAIALATAAMVALVFAGESEANMERAARQGGESSGSWTRGFVAVPIPPPPLPAGKPR